MAKKQNPDPKKVAQDIDDSFATLRDTLKAIGEELGINVNKITEAKKEYRSLLDVAQQLQNNEEEISKLSDKQIKTLRSKAEASLRDLKSTAKKLAEEREINLTVKDQLKNTKNLSPQERTLLEMAQERFSVEEQILKQLQEEDVLRDKINKKTGVMGGLLKGLSKIPIIGDIFNADEALSAAQDKIRETGSSVKGLGAAFGNIGKQITGGVLNPANMVLSTMLFIGKAILDIDSGAGILAKSLNISYTQSLKLNEELRDLAVSSGDTALNAERLGKSLMFVNNALGTSGELSKSDLETFTKLREKAGMTNEEIISMQKYSMAMGGSLKENVESFQASAKAMSIQKGVALNTKKLMADMANVSSRTKLSIEGGAAGLAKAAVAAKLMGGDLNKVAEISDKLLNFEQSIESELSAELLLGKDINLEKARQAALNNDMATVAAEITKQAGSAANFSKMNRIQQEAMASAVGMSADSLADMLVEQEALKSIGRSLNEEEQKAYQAAVDRYGVNEAAKMLKDGELENMVQQQSTAEQFAQTIEQLKEMFVAIVDGPLGSMLSLISSILSNATALKAVFAIISGAMLGKLVFGLAASAISMKAQLSSARAYSSTLAATQSKEMAIAAAKVAGAEASTLGAATPLIIGGIAAVLGAIAMFSMKDGIIGPDGGMIVSGEKGSIQLDKDDSIIAGTNLIGNNSKSSTQPKENKSTGNTQVNVDMAQTNALLQQLIGVIQSGGDVVLDGQKVGQALNLISYKTQ
jgi:hypothetical protein